MPSRAKQIDRAVANLPSIPKGLVNQFLTGPMTAEAINAASLVFKQALIEASLNAELTDHLGYAPGAEKPAAATNQRNGSTSKTVLSGDGSMRVATPRDRDGSFEPVRASQTRANFLLVGPTTRSSPRLRASPMILPHNVPLPPPVRPRLRDAAKE
jgi:hypothetical protein